MTPAQDSAESRDLTPMMQQYFAIKKTAEDCILFFRMGDFYEIFGDDAELVAPLLEIVLTSREKGAGQRIPFCGVPHHAARTYWLKLISLGFKVAIGDQVEDPAASKGLVKRAITRIYTPGCIDELEALVSNKPNYLLAVYENPSDRKIHLALADFSTGEFRAGEVDSLKEVGPILYRFKPREILSRRFFQKSIEEMAADYLREETTSLGGLSEGILRDEVEQEKFCRQVFGTSSCSTYGAVVAATLAYIQSLHASTEQFTVIKPLIDAEVLNLNEITRRDLELFETVRRRTEQGSLYFEINRTLTPMGARLLRSSLMNPFITYEKIHLRQMGARFLRDNLPLLEGARSVLKGIPDIERLLTRMISRQVQPAEVMKLRLALARVQQMGNLHCETMSPSPFREPWEIHLEQANGILDCFDGRFEWEPSSLGSDLKVFCRGYDAEFDVLRERALNGEEEIRRYEQVLKESTGIQSLKIKGHKSYGLLIEVTKSNINKIPDHFVRRQTMVNNERFVTDELMELDENLSQALDQAIHYEKTLFDKLIGEIVACRDAIRSIAESVASFDLLQSFAYKAHLDQWALPTLSMEGTIHLVGSRHPVVESHVGRHDFVPNLLHLDREASSLLITGPNMGGKSTIMRQLAVAAILHQIGSFVPCHSGTLPLFDGIFTRVGASDDLAQGQSTFMVEMAEMALILRHASKNSLVILDEVGRGTSTADGMAIALAILEDLTKRVGCYLLFSTHFHEMICSVQELGRVRLAHVDVVEEGGSIRFTHLLKPGAADRSFGIEVAKLAGLPPHVITNATFLLNQGGQERVEEEKEPFTKRKQFDSVGDKIISKLIGLNLNKTTPFQALSHLHDFQEKLAMEKQGRLFDD